MRTFDELRVLMCHDTKMGSDINIRRLDIWQSDVMWNLISDKILQYHKFFVSLVG